MILEIQKKWGNIGNWYFNKQDKTVRYQITKKSDLLNIVIPFFMNHQLRGGKLLSFLHFKYITENFSTKVCLKDKNVLLSLVVLAARINPKDKLGNKIRYLKPEQSHYVINNIIPEGVNISKLTESLANFKVNPLTLDFVHGYFETNTNLSNLSVEDQNYIRKNFLPPSIELWKFKEYYTGLNKTPPLKSFKDLGKRSFSTKATQVVPIKIYKNADLDKLRIISENKGKSGIYRWTNLSNGKSYIGSSIDLKKRFTNYFSIKLLESNLSRAKSKIYRSLLKNGYSNFSVEILEYCKVSEGINREQYYLDLYKPEYNLLKIAGSRLGSKHSDETIAKIWTPERKAKRLEHLKILHASEAHKERLKKFIAWTNSPEQRKRRLERLSILNASEKQKQHLKNLIALNKSLQSRERHRENMKILHETGIFKDHLRNLNSSEKQKEHLKKLHASRSVKVTILDTLNNETTIYNSVSEAARNIGCVAMVIHQAIEIIKKKGVSRLIRARFRVIVEGFKVINSKSDQKIKVEVIDTVTNESVVYHSQAEAAQAIGCTRPTIGIALKKTLPGGLSNLIKKRYKVKQIIKD